MATINAVTPDVPSLARCCSLMPPQCLQALASASTLTWASSTTPPLASTVSRSSPLQCIDEMAEGRQNQQAMQPRGHSQLSDTGDARADVDSASLPDLFSWLHSDMDACCAEACSIVGTIRAIQIEHAEQHSSRV